MLRSFRPILILLTFLALLALPLDPVRAADQHVVIISVDGLPAFLLDDPSAPMPTIRELARRGATAAGMRPSNPSVTWPNHTTLVTGVTPARHGVLFNGLLTRSGPDQAVRIDPRRDKLELVTGPTLYDLAYHAGMITAEINWPCTRNAPTLHFSFPDSPEALDHTTPALKQQLIEHNILNPEGKWIGTSGAARDLTWTNAARHLILNHKPRLLLLHLLNMDSTQHRYGPRTHAAHTAAAFADTCVRRVLDALDEAGLTDQTTLFIVSDHGFNAVTKNIYPNIALRNAGLLEARALQVLGGKAQAIATGGLAMIFLTDPDTLDADRRTVLDLFANVEGIDRIITDEDEIAALAMPRPSQNPHVGQILLAAKRGYAFNAQPVGAEVVAPVTGSAYLGTHGYLSTDPNMNATFIAAGASIRPGVKLELISNTDLAPTAAHLLGLQIPNPDGRILTEILTNP